MNNKECGLIFAKSLNFTEAEYEEAHKRVESCDNPNNVLVALLNSKKSNVSQIQQPPLEANKLQFNIKPAMLSSSSSSSSYSSTNSFPNSTTCNSSSSPSLESLPAHLQQQQPFGLRKIFIDGSNVARSHGKDGVFSWQGIQICVHWFVCRGHQVKVFVPMEKCQEANKSCLAYLKELNALVETPTGCNDDMFVIEAAKHNKGVIVSNDMFRHEKRIHEDLQAFVNLNRLPYVFVDDLFIPASDPRGRLGPHLDEFLTDQGSDGSQQSLHRRVSAGRLNIRFQKNYIIGLNHRGDQQHQRNHQQAYRTSSMVHSSVSQKTSQTQLPNRNNQRQDLFRTKSHHI